MSNNSVSIDEVSAAVATLSQVSGQHGVRRVSNDLDNLMRSMLSIDDVAGRTTAQLKAMGIDDASSFQTVDARAKDMGLTFDKLTFASKDFIGKLQYLAQLSGYSASEYNSSRSDMILTQYGQIQATKGQAAAQAWLNLQQSEGSARFMKMIGGAAAFIPALILLSGKSQEYNYILTQMQNRTDVVTAAFNNMRDTLGQQWKMLETRAQNIAIVIGLTLLPYLQAFLSSLSEAANHILAFVQSAGGMNQIASAVRGLAIILGAMLLPVIISVVTASLPFIATLAGLVVASVLVGHAFDALAKHFGTFQNFMRDSGPLALALKAGLMVLAGFIVGVMIEALAGMAIAAWSAASAFLVMYAPVLGVVAVIALVTFAILELVTHWKQVVGFLSSVWTNIQVTAKNIWSAIAGFFVGLWTGITTRLQLAWSQITHWLSAAWNGIVNAVKHFGQAIVAVFIWLYNHNYYFHDLVNAIIAVFQWVQSTAMAIWTAITQALAAAWVFIQNAAKTAWSLIQLYIVTPIQQALAVIIGIGSAIVTALQAAWSTVTTDVKSVWDKFVGIITGVWNAVTTAVHNNVVQPVLDAINGLINGAEQWGKNLISGLIKGMTSMLGAVGQTAGNIAGTIGKFLGFHSPAKEGPGAEAGVWAPNLMKMYTAGILGGVPLIANASRMVASALASGLTGTSGGHTAFSGSGAVSSNLLGAGGTTTHNWNLSFPNATNQAAIEAAITNVQKRQYAQSRVPGFGGGLRGGIQR